MHSNQNEGSITAYLTLILFLILALITTCVESARVSSAKTYADRVLNTAMRSTLGEYYLPLYEKYHLFGLDIGYGEVNKNEEELVNRIKQTMDDSLNPDINPLYQILNNNKNFLICNVSVDDVVIRERRTMLDKNGELLKRQAVQYQKYDSAADLVKEFLKKFNLLVDTEESNELLDKKLEVETRLYEIDKQMLKLVEYIDGFVVDENGIKLNKEGQVNINEKFAKKINNNSVSQDTVQINNSTLFSQIRDKYIRPSDIITEMISMGEHAVTKKSELDIYEDELSTFLEENDILNPIYLANVTYLRHLVRSARNDYENSIDNISRNYKKIITLVSDSLEATRNALSCIDSINKTKKEASTYVDSFIDYINDTKDKLEQSFIEELLRSSDDMKAYTEESSEKLSIIYNMNQMLETLEKNEEVLTNIKNYRIPEFFVENINSWRNELQRLQDMFLNYSQDGLVIDYSSFKLETESNKVLSSFKSLINSGIAGLVIEDIEGLSKAKLPENNLISSSMNVVKENVSEEMDDILSQVSEDKDVNAKSVSFRKIGINLGNFFLDSADAILENILYTMYLEDHCSNFLSNDTTNEQVLNYELEYILFGNIVDKENVESIATKIVFIRSMVNLLHVLTDSQKSSTALSFATAVVGFSGLPFLVSITKYIVLFVWAFEAALIETAAIMLGKTVPILTTKDNFTLEFSEILGMNKGNIIKKAKNYESAKGGFNFEYKDYIRLFLLMQNKVKQNYRTTDLIQENIRYVYDDNFMLSRCVVNYEVSARFEMPQVFMSMPFISNKEKKDVKGYEYYINAAVSY